ncbi:hypothetical protein AVEN_95568-1 [Araneus ventricosus]|uniref:Uncharacterized protein n=1 Tax=Araneus ventricosus TaxID=182803 RepID=A0A4Y2PHQ6_ARAVE|nr:hypothetical protein AVEN_95568-1 [Araneus ventricosus]
MASTLVPNSYFNFFCQEESSKDSLMELPSYFVDSASTGLMPLFTLTVGLSTCSLYRTDEMVFCQRKTIQACAARINNALYSSNDAMSVLTTVRKFGEETYNPVLLYKPQNSETVCGPKHLDELSNSDSTFALGLQTETQKNAFTIEESKSTEDNSEINIKGRSTKFVQQIIQCKNLCSELTELIENSDVQELMLSNVVSSLKFLVEGCRGAANIKNSLDECISIREKSLRVNRRYQAQEIILEVGIEIDRLPESMRRKALCNIWPTLRCMFEIIIKRASEDLDPADLMRFCKPG